MECKSCSMQYVAVTITPFHACFNNYESGARKLSKVYPNECNIYQKQFHHHFNSEEHHCMEDWKITITDRTENVLEVRHRKSYWQHRLDSFVLNWLNERYVDILML